MIPFTTFCFYVIVGAVLLGDAGSRSNQTSQTQAPLFIRSSSKNVYAVIAISLQILLDYSGKVRLQPNN